MSNQLRRTPIFCVAGFALLVSAATAGAQTVTPPPPLTRIPCPALPSLVTQLPKPTVGEAISLTVPKGTPIQVVLDKELRLRSVGQALRGHTVEPVSFDKLVIPAGSEVTGPLRRSNGSPNSIAHSTPSTPISRQPEKSRSNSIS